MLKEINHINRDQYFTLEVLETPKNLKLYACLYLEADSVVIYKFLLNRSETVIMSDRVSFGSKNKIEVYKTFLNDFQKLKDDVCQNYFPHPIAHRRHLIGVAKNEWLITSWKHSNTKPYPYLDGVAFKHRLTRFRCGCGGIFKNLRDRKYVKTFLREMEIDMHYQIPERF